MLFAFLPPFPLPHVFLFRLPSYLFIYFISRAGKYYFDDSVLHPKAVCLLFIKKQVTVQ